MVHFAWFMSAMTLAGFCSSGVYRAAIAGRPNLAAVISLGGMLASAALMAARLGDVF